MCFLKFAIQGRLRFLQVRRQMSPIQLLRTKGMQPVQRDQNR
jgi:hypothetical protein